MFVHHLTDVERVALALANSILTDLTRAHCHTCTCELCDARMNTDVQDDALAYHVPYTPAMDSAN